MNNKSASSLSPKLTTACCLLLLLGVLVACNISTNDNGNRSPSNRANDNSGSTSASNQDSPNAEVCRKYESCGCAVYDKCIETLENSSDIDKPGVRECMLASSCESLCAGDPDACKRGSNGGSTTAPQKSNCAAISCSKNSDCPADCYGGCDGVRCYSF